MKTCNRCKVEKSFTEFFKDNSNKTDGRYSICKCCKTESTLAWRAKHPDRYNEAQRRYNKKYYPKLRLHRYKLTPEQHAQMLLDQKGVCAICAQAPKGKRPLAVDHNHETGKTRGLLCYGCNRALHVLESRVLLMSALNYLVAHNKKP